MEGVKSVRNEMTVVDGSARDDQTLGEQIDDTTHLAITLNEPLTIADRS